MYIVILIIITLITILDLILTSRKDNYNLKRKSLYWSLFIAVYFNAMIILFKEKEGFQLNFLLDWININSNLNWGDLYLSIDGISIFFIELSILLIPICITMSWDSVRNLI